MKKWIKILLGSRLALIVLLAGVVVFFNYKINHGIATYETAPHEVTIPDDQVAILLFSKTTGFRHTESIERSKPALAQLARDNGWFLYETEDAGIFNTEQLPRFEAVIYNNSTGRCLTDEQRNLVEQYVANGGSLLGIHGSGDFSHPEWDWHTNQFIGASFSHHPIENHLQTTSIRLETGADSLLTRALPAAWEHNEEWYVFFDNPRDRGFDILMTIDGEQIDPNGNMLWIQDKDFGMGSDHPVAWSRHLNQGKVFYTSLGHTGEVWSDKEFLQLLTNALQWATQ